MSGEFEKTFNGGINAAPIAGGSFSRTAETVAACAALTVVFPLLCACALLIRFSMGAGVFFRQKRVGRGGRIFTLYKFRTMRESAGGLGITAANDDRITPVGKILRRSKLDELPQLFNVLRGEMSFVGPRPEIPQLVDLDDARWREVLKARPGMTDPVTLEFRSEEKLLAQAEDKIEFYRQIIQPYKLEGYLKYLRTKNRLTDWQVVFRTAKCVVFPALSPNFQTDLSAAERKIRQTDETEIVAFSDAERS